MLSRTYDILCAGELLVDLISLEFSHSLEEVGTFQRLPGGSPANLCMNMARLGNRTLLAASVGEDDFGTFLIRYVESLGVDTRLLRQVPIPTTLILVTRSREVSSFEAYRSADCWLAADQFKDEVLRQCRLFHTTCFALSREPARTTIIEAAQRAHRLNCQLSIDLNYAERIWPDREDAQEIVRRYCAMKPLVKLSEVDWIRLYESPFPDPQDAAKHFLALGASQVCVTLGTEGCLVADHRDHTRLPARQVIVKDTTGAGDAFWAGYLTAWLGGAASRDCALAGMRMAELKVSHFGPLPEKVDRSLIRQ